MALGARGYIAKPFRYPEILRARTERKPGSRVCLSNSSNAPCRNPPEDVLEKMFFIRDVGSPRPRAAGHEPEVAARLTFDRLAARAG